MCLQEGARWILVLRTSMWYFIVFYWRCFSHIPLIWTYLFSSQCVINFIYNCIVCTEMIVVMLYYCLVKYLEIAALMQKHTKCIKKRRHLLCCCSEKMTKLYHVVWTFYHISAMYMFHHDSVKGHSSYYASTLYKENRTMKFLNYNHIIL